MPKTVRAAALFAPSVSMNERAFHSADLSIGNFDTTKKRNEMGYFKVTNKWFDLLLILRFVLHHSQFCKIMTLLYLPMWPGYVPAIGFDFV